MSGIHINNLLAQHLDYTGRARPAVNLLLNPKVEEAEKLKARSPESKLIGRPVLAGGDGEIHSWFLRPGTMEGAKAAGRRAAELCLSQGVPQCDAWLINNEPPVDTPERIRLLAEFDMEFARSMSKAGKRACIGTFSRGTPQIPREDGGAALGAYAPAMRAAYEVGAWLSFHAYGKFPLLHDAEYLALRWQRHILPWYRAQGVPIPRYVITECGVDLGTGIDAQNNDGWRDTPYRDDIAAYGRDLLTLMQEYAKDPACIGATVFCAGNRGWNSFVVDGPPLEHLATLPWPKFGTGAPIPIPTPVPVPPIPTPQPTPTPAPPKEDNVNLPEWIKIEKAMGDPGQQVWRLVKAVYLPPEGEPNSQGRHHIEIMEPHDASKRVAIHNKQTVELWTLPLEKPIGEPAQNHPMYAEPNNYSAYMTGAPSDVVSGMVLPARHHVVYQLWFELVKIPETPVPVPTPTPTPQPELTLSAAAFRAVEAKQAIVPPFALPKAILDHNRRLGDNAKGYEFVSGEVAFKWNKGNYVAVLGMLPSTGEKLVAVAKKDEWARVWLFRKGADGRISEVTQPTAPIIPLKPQHTWLASPNFHQRPIGMDIDTIVWHHTGGAFKASLDWLRNPNSGASTGYLVAKTGDVCQLVSDSNAAWHAGYSRMPDGRENVNNFSIGIELENLGNGRDAYPVPQINSLVDLLKWLVYRYDIKRSGHVSHELIRSLWNLHHPNNQAGKKSDPAGLDIQRVLDRVYT